MDDIPKSEEYPAPTRHGTYYIDDGNVTLLVENTIFKVHRSMLVRDGSIFDCMFGLEAHTMPIDLDDQDASATQTDVSATQMQVEGETDDKPIRLHGDTVEEFSALLWSLYALPAEITAATAIEEAKDPKLIYLARIAHKYHFRTTETWALKTLVACYSSSAPSPSVPVIMQLTELAVLCEHPVLLSTVISKWKRLLGQGEAISTTIVIAERFNLKSLLGLAYHTMMLKGRDTWDYDLQLNRSHRVRLLSGHYTLSQMGTELASTPPRLKHDIACRRKDACKIGWASLWKTINNTTSKHSLGSQVANLPNADILGRMMLAKSVLKAFADGGLPLEGFTNDINDKCFKVALKATDNKLTEVQESLVDWFSDVP